MQFLFSLYLLNNEHLKFDQSMFNNHVDMNLHECLLIILGHADPKLNNMQFILLVSIFSG